MVLEACTETRSTVAFEFQGCGILDTIKSPFNYFPPIARGPGALKTPLDTSPSTAVLTGTVCATTLFRHSVPKHSVYQASPGHDNGNDDSDARHTSLYLSSFVGKGDIEALHVQGLRAGIEAQDFGQVGP